MPDTPNSSTSFSGPGMGDFSTPDVSTLPAARNNGPMDPTQPISPPPNAQNLPTTQRNAPANPAQPAQPHPSVQKAQMGTNIVKSISDVLAPPMFKQEIQADGTSKPVRVPRDRRDIGMSIALAALTGAFSGLGQRGPGSTGRSALAGFQATSEMREKQQEQMDKQSSADFARAQGTLDFNMRMFSAARQAGIADKAENDAVVESVAPIVDDLFENPNAEKLVPFGTKEAPLSEDEAEDIKKHSALKLQRYPVNSVPRLDKNGNQVWIGFNGKIVPEGTLGAHRAWDHGYVLVDRNAKIALSDVDGPKPWLKDAVEKWGGIVRGLSPALVAGDGAKGDIPAYVAGNLALQVHNLDSAQNTLDKFVNDLNEGRGTKLKPINLKSAIQSGTVNLKDLENLQKAAGNSGAQNTSMLSTQIGAVRNKDPKSAARLINLFGGENLKDYDQLVTAKGRALTSAAEQAAKSMTPDEAEDIQARAQAGEIVDPHRLAIAKNLTQIHQQNIVNKDIDVEKGKQAAAQEIENKQLAYIATPPGWGLEKAQTAASMHDPFQIEGYLKSQNAPIPPYLHDLIAVSQYRMPMEEFTKRLTKGTGQMDEATAATYVNKFLNPGYTKSLYNEGQKWNEDLGKSTSGTAGGTILAAGTAARHLDHYAPVFAAVNNGSIPAFNSALNALAKATGNSPQVQAQIIVDALAAETEKVVTGSVPLESRMKDAKSSLNINLSKDQGMGAIKTLANLMNDRLLELNDKNMSLFKTPLNTISGHTTQFMKKLGFETPWAQGTQQPQVDPKQSIKQTYTMPNQAGVHPTDVAWDKNGNVVLTGDGRTWVYPNGTPYAPPQQ